MITEETRAAADNFACDGCGSQLLFNLASQKLRCEHCGLEKEIPADLVEAPEYLYNPQTDSYTAPDWEAMGEKTVRCKNCGAQTAVSSAAMTAVCPFCGSQYVMDEDAITTGILPETLMPFQISHDEAASSFAKWAKGRFWAPRAFRKANHRARRLQGVYLPFWTYDADLYTSYTGMGGRDRTVHYTTTDKDGHTHTHTRVETDWFPISGEDSLSFDDRTVCAARDADLPLLQKLGAYSTKVLRRYSPAYLAGFLARRYDIGVGEGWGMVAPRMQDDMQRHIEADRGFDHYRGMQYAHHFTNVRFKHILLPVWMASYTYKNRVYAFLVNGETGRTAGKSPVSACKVAAAVLLGLAFVALVFLLLYFFGEA